MAKASDQTPLKASERTEAKKRSGPETLVLYQAIVLKGEHELKRPAKSLFWSGLAAGIAISSSLIAEAALYQHLPDSSWRHLLTAFGYSVGFVIVILGRLQLFTEHTVVSVVPVVASPGWGNLDKLARLWGIVFLTNEFGVFLASLSFAKFGLASPDLLQAMVDVSKPMLEKDFLSTLLQGIPAGFIIAAVAWMMVAAKTNHFWLIVLLTWVISAGGFTHVVASASGAYLLALTGNAPAWWPIYGFVIPALIGNIIGGSGLFAMLTFAQIKEEI